MIKNPNGEPPVVRMIRQALEMANESWKRANGAIIFSMAALLITTANLGLLLWVIISR